MLEDLESFKTEFEAAQKKFRADGEIALKNVFKKAFEKYPYLKSLNWTQYTPYFNDGDTCEFGVGEVYFALGPNNLGMPEWTEEDEEDLDYGERQSSYDLKTGPEVEVERESWNGTKYKIKEKTYPSPEVEAFGKDMKNLSQTISSESMKNILLSIFDDHVTVTVTPNGFTTEHYEHD